MSWVAKKAIGYAVKPPIKDTLEEDKPPYKDKLLYTHSVQNDL